MSMSEAAAPNPQDWFIHWAQEQPDKIAVQDWDTQTSYSYRAVHEAAERIAHFLYQERGLRFGDRIGMLAPNHRAYALLFAVAQKMGIVLVPINFRLAAAEVAYILQDAEPKFVFCHANYQHLLPQDSPMEPWEVLDRWAHELPEVYEQAMPRPHPQEDDPIFILYTSGTTGRPKGALYTHRMLLWNSINTHLRLDITTSDVTVNVMPPFHTGGWNVLTTPFWHHGATVVQMAQFQSAELLKALSQTGSTLFMAVPTMLRLMADEPDFATTELPALRYIIAGGESMPIPLIETWDRKGVPIRQGYGMTEVGPNLTSLHQNDAYRKRGSIGTPNFYIQTRLVDDNDAPVGPGERGELLLRGATVTPGYWRNAEATRKAFTRDGWYRTGDILIRDEEGYLFVVDRKKNMFISGGENVYPAEVERVLLQHESVKEAVVVPFAHATWGEAGCAFIVARDRAQVDAEALATHCKTRLAKFKVPRTYQWVEELPKNDSGKVNRLRLQEMAQALPSDDA